MKSSTPSSLKDYQSFFDEIQNTNPRAAVIITAAFLEAQLRRILFLHLDHSKNRVNDFLDKDLRSLNSKIRLAFLLGLISEDEYQDLSIVVKIRNKFAHEMHGYSFGDKEIVAWCKTFRLANSIANLKDFHFQKTHANLFILEIGLLTPRLGIKIVKLERESLA